MVFVERTIFQGLADAIRTKLDITDTMTPSTMLTRLKEILGVGVVELLAPDEPSVPTQPVYSDNVLIDEQVLKEWASVVRSATSTTNKLTPTELLAQTKSLLETKWEAPTLVEGVLTITQAYDVTQNGNVLEVA